MLSHYPRRTAVAVLKSLHSGTRTSSFSFLSTCCSRTDGLPLFTAAGHSRLIYIPLLGKPAATLLDRRRSISSSTTILQAHAGRRKEPKPTFARNKKISELGRKGKWKEMILIHEKEKEGFNNVNYATTMSQLGRIRFVDHRDPLFRAFLDDLGNQVEVRG
mmetsp:Transcript_2215/g.4018  ORF Transcript_2215/g.4018 Transcript_2215/m.4018 type:complete len:161 (-) Transcript_2215:151-633(-)